MGVGVGVVSGVSGGTRSGGEGQGLHDTGSGCYSQGLEREQLEDRVDGWQLGGWWLVTGRWRSVLVLTIGCNG